jgi:hypothetical protein
MIIFVEPSQAMDALQTSWTIDFFPDPYEALEP